MTNYGWMDRRVMVAPSAAHAHAHAADDKSHFNMIKYDKV